MKLSIHQRMGRRDLVKLIGSAAFALPALELFEPKARAQTAAKQAKFAVFMYTNDGMHPAAFFAPNMSQTLSPLVPYKDQVIVLGAQLTSAGIPVSKSGLAYKQAPAQHRANICLTASNKVLGIVAGQANATGGPAKVNKNDGPSMDYVIAQSFKQLPLLLSMHPCGGDTPSEVTFDESGNPLTRLFTAPTILSSVFGGAVPMTGADGAAALAKQNAITNFLNAHFATLRPHLSVADQAVMDQHLTQLVAYENDAATKLMNGANLAAGCAAPSASAVPAKDAQDGSEVQPLSQFIMQTIAIAFHCNMNRVATVSFGYPGGGGVGGLRMPWLSYRGASFDDPQHFVSHNGGDATLIGKYAAMNQWTVGQMAYLMGLLKAIPSASGGTLLDETAIYLFNRHGDGNVHSNYALPGIVGGGAGGYFKTGQNLQLAATNPTDVLISMGRAMGANVPNFPLQTFKGVACPSYDGPYSSSTELASIKA
jgi:Protein of unknown function (DUF1552)